MKHKHTSMANVTVSLAVLTDSRTAVSAAALCFCLLQERLDAAALAFKAERAKMAEEEIIAMEVGAAPRCVLVYLCKPFMSLHQYPA